MQLKNMKLASKSFKENRKYKRLPTSIFEESDSDNS